nr:hypothetical protein CFP56_13315 [Quercus suber]
MYHHHDVLIVLRWARHTSLQQFRLLEDGPGVFAAAAGEAPPDLVGHVDLLTQLVGPRKHQAGVLLERAADGHQVQAVLRQQLLGERGVLDGADAGDEHRVADGLLGGDGEGGLVGGADVRMLQRVVAAGGDVEDVDAAGGEQGREAGGVVGRPGLGDRGLLLEPVGGADAQEERHGVRDRGADFLGDLEGQARAVLEGAAVGVGAGVADGGEEGVEEVALEYTEMGSASQHGLAARSHGWNAHLARSGVLLVPGDGRGRPDVVGPAVQLLGRDSAGAQPRRHGARFAAGVGQLDHDVLVLAVDELDDAAHRFDLRVFPQADVFRRDAPLGGHGGGFDARQARPALGDAANVGFVPRRVVSVLRGVLAEGGEHDPVLDRHASDRHRFEELGHVFLTRDNHGGPSRGSLGGGEVGDAIGRLVGIAGFLLGGVVDVVVGRHGV